jgi:hypothetical protein
MRLVLGVDLAQKTQSKSHKGFFQAYNLFVSVSPTKLHVPSGAIIGREKDIASLRDLLQQ